MSCTANDAIRRRLPLPDQAIEQRDHAGKI
jgi:hypothetical protein